jgi:predicted RNase H-like HicB family nuclease
MTYDILIQQQAPNHYTAIVLGWPDLVVEGESEETVLQKAQTAIQERLAQGKIVHLEIEPPNAPHPLQQFAGMWKDDDSFDDFLSDMATYRQQVDAETSSR